MPAKAVCRSLVFLIGYRGTGKTTVASLLGQALDWNWRDTDAEIEKEFGQSIAQIFADEREAGFREKEARVLESMCKLEKHVIATGGGIVLRPRNRWRMQETGWVVWLRGEPAILWQRLQEDGQGARRRPDLSCGGLAEIDELLRLRTPLYSACADFAVDTTGKTKQEVTEQIALELAARRVNDHQSLTAPPC
jgi:shikimate kinase